MGWAACQLPLDLLRVKPVCAQELLRLTGVFQEAMGMDHLWGCLCFGPLQNWKGTVAHCLTHHLSPLVRKGEVRKLRSYKALEHSLGLNVCSLSLLEQIPACT